MFRMFNRRPLTWATCALLFVSGMAHAQSTTTAGPSRAPVEVSPFVSATSGSASGVGAAVRWPLVSKIGLELDTEYRSGEVPGLNSSLNVVFDLPAFRRVTPYVVGGAGFERFGVAEFFPEGARPPYVPGNGLLVQARTGAVVNLGGGLRVPINERWGVRVDVRYTNGLSQRDPERLRVFWGATVGIGKR
jgi:hypothetical protein